jgi:hypothetical protein
MLRPLLSGAVGKTGAEMTAGRKERPIPISEQIVVRGDGFNIRLLFKARQQLVDR